jgi:hypothetical protein
VLAGRHSRSYVLHKWLRRHRQSIATLSTVACLAVAGIGYHVITLRAERAKAETAERIAAITPKNVEQITAERAILNSGVQNERVGNGTPDVLGLNSLSGVRDFLSSAFELSDAAALKVETMSSPIRYYSGNRIGDGVAGVRHRNSSYTPGIVGTAFSFNGQPDSAVYIPADDTLNNLTNGTVDAWINTTDSRDPAFETQVILYKEWAFTLSIKNGRLMTFDWTNSTEFLTEAFVADGKWHHLAMSLRSGVQDGTVLYVDGVEVATTTLTINRQRPRDVVIGSWAAEEGSFCNFVGAIDEVHIWNRVLTPTEVEGLVRRNAVGKAAWGDNRIDDGSFETKSAASASILDRPMHSSWKFKGISGIAYNDSPFGNGTSPDGSQVAFIQQQSEIHSTFELSRGDDYQLVLLSKGRDYGEKNPIEVSIDGTVIGTVTPSSNVDYTPSLFDLPNLPAGSHDISFKGVDQNDATSFIDSVSLSLAKPTPPAESR